jgi:hypothetical protein
MTRKLPRHLEELLEALRNVLDGCRLETWPVAHPESWVRLAAAGMVTLGVSNAGKRPVRIVALEPAGRAYLDSRRSG